MRWIYSILLVLAGGFTAVMMYPSIGDRVPTEDPDIDPSVPSPRLSPEQVVACQVTAMHQSIADESLLVPCYSLASPSNRAMTGPLHHFWAMCHSPPYDLLCESDSWQIGKAQIEDSRASVIVSVLTHDGPRGFEFQLSRQQSQPVKDCWMTDSVAVLPILDVTHRPSAEGS
ncbi:MAG: hypothetical protein KDB00_00290 [Planctomycetales bacterium]|nr:hypothetical protein [Planctomycetales bacterium]